MVGRSHDKLRAAFDLAEFAYDQFVPENGIIEQYVVLFKPRGILFVVIISIVADDDIGRFDDVFDKTRRSVFVWKYRIRAGNIFDFYLRSKSKIGVTTDRTVFITVRFFRSARSGTVY